MFNNIVHIESSNKNNGSFGTGFVIDKCENGIYILTCQHVVDEVKTPTVNDKPAEIVATSEFLDMAVLHVKGLDLQPFPLQIEACEENDVHAIAFAKFTQELVQKKEIQATLFDDVTEIHSKENNAFYIVRRLKAEDDYRFEKGNSGAPLICEATGKVIAMISHMSSYDNYAYAIEIASLKEIWRDLTQKGSAYTHRHFYDNINTFTNRIEENFNTRKQSVIKHATRLHNMGELQKEIGELKKEIKIKNKLRSLFVVMVLVTVILTGYYIFTLPENYEPENYKVVNVSTNDVLNIRADKGTIYPVLGAIPFDATNVAVTVCKANDAGKEWCKVTYGSITGWVRSKYIEKEEDSFDNINSEDTSSFRDSNDNIFLQFSYPPSVKPGETILIAALLQNNGIQENQGGVTLSFPQRPILQWKVDYSTFEQVKQYKVFDEIYNHHPKQGKVMRAIHPIIEASSSQWKENEEHIVALSIVAPQDMRIFRIRVRASLTPDRVIPERGTVDQQAFQSQEIIIRIEE
jgi:hypothetical protein